MIHRLLTGLGGLILLTAALVGLPMFLLAAHQGLADQLPTLGEVPDALLGPGDGGLFLLLLFAVGWVCWAVFVLAFLAEVVARARGVQAPHLGPFIPQATTARAVSAVLLLVTLAPSVTAPAAVNAATTDRSASSTSAPAAVPLPATPMRGHTPPPATAVVTPAAHQTGTVPTAQGPEETQTEPVQDYTVVRGDTLWDIADEQLDDPTRYPEIVEASEEIEQAADRHLVDPDLILPGWTLHIPTDEPAAVDPVDQPLAAEALAPEQVPPPGTPMQAPATGPGSGTGRAGATSATAGIPTPSPATAMHPRTVEGAALPGTPLHMPDERSTPGHGVPGLPTWITAPLIPTHHEDAPDAVALITAAVAARDHALANPPGGHQ